MTCDFLVHPQKYLMSIVQTYHGVVWPLKVFSRAILLIFTLTEKTRRSKKVKNINYCK